MLLMFSSRPAATLRSDPPIGKRGSAPSAKDALRDHQPTEVSLGYASASTKVHVPNILRITRDLPTKVNNSTLEVAHLDEATIVVQQWHLCEVGRGTNSNSLTSMGKFVYTVH